MALPEVKKQLLGEESLFGDAPFAKGVFPPEKLFYLGRPQGEGVAEYEQRATETVAAVAERMGVDPWELLYVSLVAGQTFMSQSLPVYLDPEKSNLQGPLG